MIPVLPVIAVIPWFKRGGTGWALLAVGVIAWDVAAPESLSGAFRRATTHRSSAIAAAACWALLTAHLWGVLPERRDPFTAGLGALRRRVR